jgi:hypothetical protein
MRGGGGRVEPAGAGLESGGDGGAAVGTFRRNRARADAAFVVRIPSLPGGPCWLFHRARAGTEILSVPSEPSRACPPQQSAGQLFYSAPIPVCLGFLAKKQKWHGRLALGFEKTRAVCPCHFARPQRAGLIQGNPGSGFLGERPKLSQPGETTWEASVRPQSGIRKNSLIIAV